MDWVQYLLLGAIAWFLLRRTLPVKGLADLTPGEVKERLKNGKDYVFVDVREVHEYREGHIKGFQNIPLSQLARRLDEIDRGKPVVLTCRSGMRSRQAARILKKNGFSEIAHLKTGISGWDGKLTR